MTRKKSEKTAIREVLRKYGIRAKKKLGQHWLVSEEAVRRIVEACTGAGGILEIGPGIGTLTKHLVHIAPTWAIELDERLKKILSESVPLVQIVIGNFLKVDLNDILARLPKPRVIVSNLPFYITTPILERVLSVSEDFDRAVIMLQKEVGGKLMAKVNDSRRIALSVLYQYRFTIETVCKVSKRDFIPQPSVDTIVLKLHSKNIKSMPDNFEELVRTGFHYPRKTLLRNFLEQGVGDKESIQKWLTECEITTSARPHQLSVEDWVRLASRVPFRKN